MLKTLRFSLKKSKILAKLRKEVESIKFNTQSISEDAINDTIKGKAINSKELYIEELLTLLSEDRATINLLAEYKLKFDDLKVMISTLEQHGAGQVVKGHYIAVSSIAFIKELNILCSYWENDGFKIEHKSTPESNDTIAYWMLQSFSNRK